MKKHARSSDPEYLVICCIADTHLLHWDVELPPGNLLIHAGDLCHMGGNVRALADVNDWLGRQSFECTVCVPGNHDAILETNPAARRILTNAEVLINQGIEFKGLRIWGSPVTIPSGGAFGVSLPEDRRRVFSGIPTDTDVLITHGPPFGILDSAPDWDFHAGDPELLRAIQRLSLKLHVWGHIHAAHGVDATAKTIYVNAAMLGEDGGIGWQPIVLRLPKVR